MCGEPGEGASDGSMKSSVLRASAKMRICLTAQRGTDGVSAGRRSARDAEDALVVKKVPLELIVDDALAAGRLWRERRVAAHRLAGWVYAVFWNKNERERAKV